jgi:hypothetical protein
MHRSFLNRCPRVRFFPESHHQQASDSFFFHEVGPDESVTVSYLKEDRSLALDRVCRPDCLLGPGEGSRRIGRLVEDMKGGISAAEHGSSIMSAFQGSLVKPRNA